MKGNKQTIIEAIAIIILVVSAIIVWINITLRQPEESQSKPIKNDFGVVRNENIYIDNMPIGEYTSHGRLITKN